MKTQWVIKLFYAFMIVLLVLAAMPVTSARAAIAQQETWSTIYAGAGAPGTTAYPFATTNTTQMLVVAVSSSMFAAGTQTATVSYGGQSLTSAIDDGATTAEQHTWLFYLLDAGISLAANSNLTVTITSSTGTIRQNHVYAAVYTGVDQTTPIGDIKNFNSAATAGTAVGPFSTALTIGSNAQAVEIVNLTRTASQTAAAISTWATNWAAAAGPNPGSYNAPGGGTQPDDRAYSAYVATNTTAGNTSSQHTVNVNVRRSMTAMAINAAILPTHNINTSVVGSGIISPPGPVAVEEGLNQTFDIAPNAGSILAGVSIDGGASIGRFNSYTFTNVTANHAITATFDGGWSQPANNSGGGWANEAQAYTSDNTYATADGGGDETEFYNFGLSIPACTAIQGIEVALEGNATNNREVTIDLTWDAGNNFSSTTFTTAFVNGGTDTTYIFGGPSNTWGHTWNLTNDFTNNNFRVRLDATGGGGTNGDVNIDQVQVKVYTAAVPCYTINTNAGPGGTITPAGPVSVTQNSNQSFGITPNTTYIVDTVTSDVTAQPGHPNAFTYTSVMMDHTLFATFNGGWSQPSASTDIGWTADTAAYVSDNAYATSNNGGEIIVFQDFNLSIPVGSTINGIEVAIEGNATASREVTAALSWAGGGANYTTTLPQTSFTNGGTDATIILGSPAITWGRTWSQPEFSNANFRLALVSTGGGGDLNVDQVQVKVHYTLPNTPPTGGNGTVTTNEDTTYTFQVSDFPYSDSESNPFAGIRVTSLETAGTLQCNGVDILLNGTCSDVTTLTFQPAANAFGTPYATYGFQVYDGTAYSAASYTMTVNVNAVNDAPVCNNVAITTNEDTTGTTLPDCSDVDGNTLTFSTVGAATNGTESFVDPNLTYAPDANFNGADSFTYQANDGTVNSLAATVNVTVNAVNDAPVCNNVAITTNEDTTGTTLPDCSDVDGDPLTYSTVGAASNGTESFADPNLTYAPDANFNGADSFTYQANDGTVNSLAATVNVTVNTVNDAPVCNNVAITTNEDTTGTTLPDCSDVDGDPLTYSTVGAATNGTESFVDPNLTYAPDANFNGADSFTYQANDGTVNSLAATVNVTVNAVNDAPVCNNVVITTNEDTTGTTLPDCSDVDGDPLTYSTVSAATNGTESFVDPNLTYAPDANFNGADSFTYQANDGTVNSLAATVNVTVNPVNDAPAFIAGPDQTVNEDAVAQSVAGWATGISAGPADESGQTLNFNITGNDNPGLFSSGPTVAANGTLTYTPALNANGVANITLTLSDNGGTANGGVDTSASQSFVITIDPVNDAPISSNVTDTTNEDTPQTVTLAYTDVESDPATSCSVFGVANGSISTACACALGVCTVGLTPAANSTTSVTANFTVDNGQVSNTSLITLNVTAVNDAPVTSDVNDTTNEDTEQIITLSYIDTEGDFANSCSVTGVTNGSVSTACACAAGVCTVGLTPALNSALQVTADYTVNDGAVSNTSNITLNVTPVDDNPVAVDDPVTVPGNAATIIDVLGNDTDVDGGTINVASTGAATNGTVTNNTSNVTYEPNTNYCGTDSFTYTLNGGSTATVNVTVACSPVFTSADNAAFDLGFPDTFGVTATGNPTTMTISMTGAPAGITLADNGNGIASLIGDGTTPVGVYNLIFTADNGVSPNGIQNFTLTIRNGPFLTLVNSAPDTGNGSISENEAISNALGITQIIVEFDRDVYDDPADLVNFDDDVTNPANYLLVRSVTGTFATTGCTGGTGSDVKMNVNSVTYSNNGGSGPFVATLDINDGFPLNVEGFYKLFICGSTSIVDATNQGLSLAGDGTNPGTDFVRNFRIAAPATGGGGNDDDGNNASRNAAIASSVSQGGVLIPVTGFTPNQVTTLPAQSTEYAASKLTLEIPSISLNLSVVGIEFKDNTWDVTWLGGNAGYLEGSAYPTWTGNTILTGHVTNPNGKPGPFAHLTDLKPGQKIYIHNNGFVYVYEVRKSSLIAPSAIKTLFKHEDDTWLSLVTCENFSDATGKFTHRRLVRAVLISIIPEK